MTQIRMQPQFYTSEQGIKQIGFSFLYLIARLGGCMHQVWYRTVVWSLPELTRSNLQIPRLTPYKYWSTESQLFMISFTDFG